LAGFSDAEKDRLKKASMTKKHHNNRCNIVENDFFNELKKDGALAGLAEMGPNGRQMLPRFSL